MRLSIALLMASCALNRAKGLMRGRSQAVTVFDDGLPKHPETDLNGVKV